MVNKKTIKGLALPGPCDISLGCCEATIYYKDKEFARLPGFYSGMSAVDLNGEAIATFCGSDECGGCHLNTNRAPCPECGLPAPVFDDGFLDCPHCGYHGWPATHVARALAEVKVI